MNKKLIVAASAFLAVAGFCLNSDARTREHLSDDGYQMRDGGRAIKFTAPDSGFSEIVSRKPGVATPCKGKNLPVTKTRNARVERSLDCRGQKMIREKRSPENFASDPGFKAAADTGDQNRIYSYMRENSKTQWDYDFQYSTNVNWTWTKKVRGHNGSRCGYNYIPDTCTRTYTVERESCVTTPDYSPGSGGGGGGGGFSPGGGGGGYESTNHFGFFDILIPKAYAGTTCSWSYSGTRTETYSCYHRQPRQCVWEESHNESMVCTRESLPVRLKLEPKSEEIWHPDAEDYVPFLPNGNDLLPGEIELMSLDLEIIGNSIRTSSPNVGGGMKGEAPAYYQYTHSVKKPRFSCVQNANNGRLVWQLKTQDRQMSVTPNSLVAQQMTGLSEAALSQDGLEKTGLVGDTAQVFDEVAPGVVQVDTVPTELKILDSSSRILNTITSAFRRNDRHQTEGVEVEQGETIRLGEASAGENKRFWKDTFYRIRLVEVFPEKNRGAREIAVAVVQTDSLISRRRNMIKVPLAGQSSDTDSVYNLSTSGVVFQEASLKAMNLQYQLIPDQAYELRVSMLHRGIPFYYSGCEEDRVSCEREEPNLDAFSRERAIRFVYQGKDERSILRKAYDWRRRVLPW